MICFVVCAFDFLLEGFRQLCKQRFIINHIRHIKHAVISIKSTVPTRTDWQEKKERRERGADCTFAFLPNLPLLCFRILPQAVEAAQTVKIKCCSIR